MSLFKTVTVIALTVAATHALADWVEIGGGQKGGANNSTSFTMYYDPAKTTNGVSKDFKKIVVLQTYEKKQPLEKGISFISMATRMDVDCPNQKFQPVGFFFYSEPMAGGNIVKTISEPSYNNNWEYPAPNSAMETLIEKACKR